MTRPYKAGIAQGKALVELINLHYIDKGIMAMLLAVRTVINEEIKRRLVNDGRHHTSETRPTKKTSTNKRMRTS